MEKIILDTLKHQLTTKITDISNTSVKGSEFLTGFLEGLKYVDKLIKEIEGES